MIAEGRVLLDVSLRRTGEIADPYQLQAAIAAEHDRAPEYGATDWNEVVRLYDLLLSVAPSQPAALARVVAVAELDGPAAGLAAMAGQSPSHRWHAVRSELLAQEGRYGEAVEAATESLTGDLTEPERRFREGRRAIWLLNASAAVGDNERMLLPVMPPVAPMLAKSVPQIPEGALSFEPKWDGFRSIVFRDGDEVEIGSRNERPMTRYFPEVVAAIKQSMPERCVVDGEIIVVVGDRLEFEVLQQRIHPAASRIKLLSEQTPARFMAFDLLALDDVDYTHEPFEKRRGALGRSDGGRGAADSRDSGDPQP